MQKEACMAFLSYLVGSGSAHLPDIILTSSSSPHSSISKGCLSSRSLDNCLSQLTQVMTQISPKKPFQSKWHTLFLFLNHSLLSSSSFFNYLFLTVLGFFSTCGEQGDSSLWWLLLWCPGSRGPRLQ